MMRSSRLPTLFIALLYALLAASPVVAQSPPAYHHSFKGAEHWAQVFDDPKRDAWQKPHEVIQALGLKSDAVIADIGSGTGYFSVRLARVVPKGRVYGVDIEPDMVKYLAARAQREGLKNVISVQGELDNPLLPEKVDLVLMVDTFHHIDDRVRYFSRLRDALKPGGRIAIIDYRIDSPEGPPKSMRSTPEEIKDELNHAGYVLVREYDFLPKQYFLIFEAAKK